MGLKSVLQQIIWPAVGHMAQDLLRMQFENPQIAGAKLHFHSLKTALLRQGTHFTLQHTIK